MNTQDKFEHRLAGVAKQAHLDFIKDATFTNVGTYRLQVPDTFRSVIEIDFDWQKDYATFKLASIPNHQPPHDLPQYVEQKALDQFFRGLAAFISGWGERDGAVTDGSVHSDPVSISDQMLRSYGVGTKAMKETE